LLRDSQPEDQSPQSFSDEEAADLRRQYMRQAIRLALAFLVLFGGVFLAFWWSGSAIRFGASRVGDRGAPTWRVTGSVRSAASHKPIPWARVEDDPAGDPPFFQADTDQYGAFDLLTLGIAHQIRISAWGYRTAQLRVGRAWFFWLPQGSQRLDVELTPD